MHPNMTWHASFIWIVSHGSFILSHDSFIVTPCIHSCQVLIHLHVCCDALTYAACHYSHDSFTCVTHWPEHICSMGRAKCIHTHRCLIKRELLLQTYNEWRIHVLHHISASHHTYGWIIIRHVCINDESRMKYGVASVSRID